MIPSGPGVKPAWARSALAFARSYGYRRSSCMSLKPNTPGASTPRAGPARAFHEVVEDRLAIDRVQERLAHAYVVERRHAGMQAREDDADTGRLVNRELRVFPQRRQLRGRGEQHHVGVPRLQRDHTR